MSQQVTKTYCLSLRATISASDIDRKPPAATATSEASLHMAIAAGDDVDAVLARVDKEYQRMVAALRVALTS